jgi:hypothetical protein
MLQSVASLRPRKVMASFLPFRPWSYPDRRVFGRKVAGRLEFSTTGILSCTSTPPQRLAPLRTVQLPTSHADHEPLSSNTRKSFAALQHIRTEAPLFSQARWTCVRSAYALPTGSTAPRVWLPSLRCETLNPWRSFSASNALGLFPSEPFSHPAIEAEFPLLPPLLRFLTKPCSSLVPALQRFSLAR